MEEVSVCEPISDKGRRRAPMVPTSDLEDSSLLWLYTILVPSTYLFAISRRPSRRIHLVNSQYADLKTRKWQRYAAQWANARDPHPNSR